MADDPIEIHFFAPGFEEFFIRYAQQIGKGEIFVETEETVPVDTPVTVIFQLIYEDMELIRASGTVSGVVKKTASGDQQNVLPGIVVKLNEMDETFRAYLVELIKRQLRSDLSKMFTT